MVGGLLFRLVLGVGVDLWLLVLCVCAVVLGCLWDLYLGVRAERSR